MRKTYREKLADKRFLNKSFASIADLKVFQSHRNHDYEDILFEDREILTEKLQEFHALRKSEDPLINGIPLSEIMNPKKEIHKEYKRVNEITVEEVIEISPLRIIGKQKYRNFKKRKPATRLKFLVA